MIGTADIAAVVLAANQSQKTRRNRTSRWSNKVSPWAASSSPTKMLSQIPNAASSAYPTSFAAVGRRTKLTSSAVSQTETAADRAKERPSMAIHVTRGSTAKVNAAASATRMLVSCRVSTITPAVAAPTARRLGKRRETADEPTV